MSRPLFGAILAAFWMLTGVSPVSAEIDFWKAVDVSGKSDMSDTVRPRWRPLAEAVFLKTGQSIRTGKNGTVDIVLNRSRESVVRLNENSRLDIVEGSPWHLRLSHGSLCVLLEAEGDRIQVSTPRSSAELAQGGVFIETGASGDLWRVFSEAVRLKGVGAVPEGLQVRVSSGGEIGKPERMRIEDYTDWQRWFKENYARKDDPLYTDRV